MGTKVNKIAPVGVDARISATCDTTPMRSRALARIGLLRVDRAAGADPSGGPRSDRCVVLEIESIGKVLNAALEHQTRMMDAHPLFAG
jgi:hypothetical protein